MSRSLTIIVTSSPSMHDFRNFGEDVYRAIRDTSIIDLAKIDASQDRFSIRDISPKDKGGIIQKIKKLARKYSIEVEIKNETEPNKAMQPTPVAVTPRADARVAPSTSVADLRR